MKGDPAAIAWARETADKGDAEVMYRLGSYYAEGIRTLQDLVRAHKWLNLATAHGGLAAARDARDRIAPIMTNEELREARSQARKWWAKRGRK